MASDPKAVVQAFVEECNSGNGVDRIVACFTDDGVITVHPSPPPPDPGVYSGKDALRAWFEPQMHNFHVDTRNLQANGDTVTWESTASSDMFRQMGIDSFEVACEARVRDGKITSFTLTQPPETVEKFQRVMMQSGAGETMP